ncbi:MAG: hypothetical protein FWG87_15240 [Defluviitaleaceae bacterium]|nr:hypothetical protein [Defluviitaleaceae bacterium]
MSDIFFVGMSSRALVLVWWILRAWNADLRGFDGFSRILKTLNTDLRRLRGFYRAWRIVVDFPTSLSA